MNTVLLEKLMLQFDTEALTPVVKLKFKYACMKAISQNENYDEILYACKIYYQKLLDFPDATL